MDTKYLNFFITMAEERNMTKAAEKLFVSQSSLSYHLSKLESEVGTALFLRTKNDLILTPAGNLYLETAYKVMELKDRLYQNISNLNNRGIIRISVTSVWGNQMLADIIPLFKKTFPDLIFELSQLDDQTVVKKKIFDGDIDYALISVPYLEPDEHTEVLREEELLFAVPANHPYTKKNSGQIIDQKTLAQTFFHENILISKKTSANRYLAEQLFLNHMSALPPKFCEINGIPLTCTMVARETGVSFIPTSGKSLENKIHYYSCEPKLYRYNIMMHRKNLIFHRPEQVFFDCVKKYFSHEP